MSGQSEAEIDLNNRLMEMIAEKNGCNVVCNRSFKTMWIHNDDYSVEFRCVILGNKIIISRVCFSNRRNGCMSECLVVLKDFTGKLKYNIIEIQAVETFEMMKWCNKMGFISNKYSLRVKDDYDREVILGDYDLIL